MTMEEAIQILKAIRVYECYPKSASEETKEAIDMAIEALSVDVVQGEWRCMADYGIPECDQCGFASEHKYNYCPNCGVRMKGGDSE